MERLLLWCFPDDKKEPTWSRTLLLRCSLNGEKSMSRNAEPSAHGVRVIHTVPSLLRSAGGPTRTVTALCSELGRRGVHVDLVTENWIPLGADVNLLPPSEWVTTTLVQAHSAPFIRTLRSRVYRTALRQRCEAGRPQVFHNHGLWLPTNHAAADVAKERGLPLIISTRGMLEPWALSHRAWKKRLAWFLYQQRDLLTARVLHATAQQEADSLRRLGLRQPIALIPNGVELFASTEEAKPISSPRIALFVGRIHPVKGLIPLVDAWSRVRPRGWLMIIAGPDEGGHRAAVEERIQGADLSAAFELVGPVEGAEKAALYRSAELFLLPSFTENFGVAAAEALAAGVPVIATKGTPWAGLVQHRCGWWVDLGVDSLVSALEEATRTRREVLHEMGERGRAYAEGEFGWPGIAQEMLAVYRWMLGQGDRPECVQLDSE
ncbi:glycosyltransferase [Thiocapsa rosea]|uniref:Glycosyltransferase involved in cell wall biosynthesis n=1 Tax=Thiocapsa rosea TaxID=69360 RepID=A0A495V774_9GAMM|nr:glycosyltransferase [Thiocapsa rosea]RKT45241.1 glycosyltransferase involved in cell wall biosynthesis [Thiocapsa rosea]